MPIINKAPVNTDNDDDHYEALVNRQMKVDKNYDTLRNYRYIPIGSTVAVQREDGGPGNYRTIVEKCDPHHNDRSYKVKVTMTGWLTTRNSKHLKAIPITGEEYLRGSVIQGHKDRHV